MLIEFIPKEAKIIITAQVYAAGRLTRTTILSLAASELFFFAEFYWHLVAHSTDFVICQMWLHMTYGFLLLYAYVQTIS